MFKTNIEGTKQMLELGNKLNIEKFIYTSSAATLGEKKEVLEMRILHIEAHFYLIMKNQNT